MQVFIHLLLDQRQSLCDDFSPTSLYSKALMNALRVCSPLRLTGLKPLMKLLSSRSDPGAMAEITSMDMFAVFQWIRDLVIW